MSTVFAFEVWVVGFSEGSHIINAQSLGKAKYQVWRDILDPWPDTPFTAMRGRKIGPAHTSEQFKRNAVYRGMPDIKCGQRVRVGTDCGTIVGHNSSANFNVLFDDDSPKYAGLTLNVHPQEIEIVKEGEA